MYTFSLKKLKLELNKNKKTDKHSTKEKIKKQNRFYKILTLKVKQTEAV